MNLHNNLSKTFKSQLSNSKLTFSILNSEFSIQNGFTFPELVVVMAILAILFGIVTINLVGARNQVSLSTSTEQLVADLKLQQVQAMTGETLGQATSDSYGVYFIADKYTVFKGTTYSSINSTNEVATLDASLEFSAINLPSSTIIFSKVTGEVANFNQSLSTITIRNMQKWTGRCFTI